MRAVRVRPLALALLAIPALASAQRGGGGFGRAGGFGRNDRDNPALAAPAIVNGVNLLIQHRVELALTDTQLVRVVALKRGLDSTNVPLMRRLDSLQRAVRPSNDPTARANSAERVRDTRVEMREVLKEIYANIQPVRDRAFALLSEAQTERAHAIEDQARRQADAAADGARGTGRRGTPPG
jgi:hypothetical protein